MKKLILCSLTAALTMAMVLSCNQKQKVDSWQQDETTGKWGFVSHTGEVVVPYKYDSMQHIRSRALAAVSLNGKWGIVNSDNNTEVVPCKYDFIDEFDHFRKVKVNIGGRMVDGEMTGGKWGVLNETGEEIAPCIYDYVGSGSDQIRVNLGDETGVINLDGNFIQPLARRESIRYAGSATSGNETRNVSFTVETTNGADPKIKNFSFEVEKDLGAGEGAMSRKQNFSVKTSQDLEVPENGLYESENILMTLGPDSADCTIINEGQRYSCTALRQ